MFNQITLEYTSPSPAVCTAVYETDHQTVEDTFYLEAAENGVFRLLIKGAVDKKKAENFQLCSIRSADGSECRTEIHSVSTSECPIPEESWLEKDGIRLGITLEMGGAIASLHDKNAPSGYTNLLNRFDPGRLVQQSYYGTSDAPYVRGEFMGNPWPYNPVQGGDRAGNRSRIIEYTRTDTEVYIKAQPYDWGHEGSITPSYMENRYVFLENGVIRVDNRFVDFSGLTHHRRDQELPAFYVVSALDTFTWEDCGVRRSRDDMIFWPLAKDQNFYLTDSDTAFSAWHDKNGYGVGLAVPGVEQYYAGRYEFDGSPDPHAASTNYTAPLRTFTLHAFKPLMYSYLLAAGDIESIAERFRETLPALDNTSLKEYDC